MIPPLTEEEFRRLVPMWAQELRGQGCPLAEGLPVYCVLYGPKYGGDHNARGVIHKMSHDGSGCSVHCREHGDACWWSSSASAYHVPDMETEEGKQHVEKWKRGEIPPFPPYERIHPPMSTEGLDPIGALAIGLFVGDEPPDSVMPLERLDELYQGEESRKKDFESVDLAIEFVDSCLSARRFDHLQAGWRYVDLSRIISVAAILSLTTSSHLVRPKTLLPERTAFIERCRDEFRRRGMPDDRISNLLKGLSWE